MLFKENIGLKIEEEYVRSIIDFLTDKGWVKQDLKIKYYEPVGVGFATDWGKSDDLDVLNTIQIPKCFYTDKYIDNERVMGLVLNLKELYKFDLIEIAEINNIPLDKLIVLFCILHEIGHGINSYKQVKAFKDNRTYFKELKLRQNIAYSMHFSVRKGEIIDKEKFDKANLDYRKMNLERIADRYAMKFMKLYGKELCCMANNKIEYETIAFV